MWLLLFEDRHAIVFKTIYGISNKREETMVSNWECSKNSISRDHVMFVMLMRNYSIEIIFINYSEIDTNIKAEYIVPSEETVRSLNITQMMNQMKTFREKKKHSRKCFSSCC